MNIFFEIVNLEKRIDTILILQIRLLFGLISFQIEKHYYLRILMYLCMLQNLPDFKPGLHWNMNLMLLVNCQSVLIARILNQITIQIKFWLGYWLKFTSSFFKCFKIRITNSIAWIKHSHSLAWKGGFPYLTWPS